jgi:uncharacterized membrane protein
MNLLFLLAQRTLAVDPFWNTALGVVIIVVLVLVAILAGGLAFALRAQKKTPQQSQRDLSTSFGPILAFLKDLFGDFTNVLAWVVIILAFIGIFFICYVALKDKDAGTPRYVFGAVLPLLGTWVGAVLAHYFQKENLAAATQSITDLASKVAGTDKLKSTPVKTVMIRAERIDTLPDNLVGNADDKIKLSELVTHMDITIKRDRIPIFKDNKKTGPSNRVLHRSIIERFITKQALTAKLDAAQMANLTLADLMNDKELGPVVLGSFALVKDDATLADAKNAMDNASAALGPAGNCYDVFVTDNGKADEIVIGWITNDIINDNAKV